MWFCPTPWELIKALWAVLWEKSPPQGKCPHCGQSLTEKPTHFRA